MTVDLHYVEDGPRDARPLILAGSLGSTLEIWRPNVEALAKELRVVRFDHRGHGRSPVPEPPYRMADLAGDALALLDRLGLERVNWCGLSLGGMVGMFLASEHPDRIERLILCCTSAHFPDRKSWDDRIAAVRSGGTAQIAEQVVSRWFTPDWAATHPDVVAETRNAVAETPDAGYLGCCQAIAEWDHRDRLASITAPTLIIGGRSDPSTPIEPHSRTLAESIPGAKFEILDAAHAVTVERADEVNALILEHLR